MQIGVDIGTQSTKQQSIPKFYHMLRGKYAPIRNYLQSAKKYLDRSLVSNKADARTI